MVGGRETTRLWPPSWARRSHRGSRSLVSTANAGRAGPLRDLDAKAFFLMARAEAMLGLALGRATNAGKPLGHERTVLARLRAEAAEFDDNTDAKEESRDSNASDEPIRRTRTRALRSLLQLAAPPVAVPRSTPRCRMNLMCSTTRCRRRRPTGGPVGCRPGACSGCTAQSAGSRRWRRTTPTAASAATPMGSSRWPMRNTR